MFSIIIVNFNTKDLLKDCLNSIIKKCLGSDFEIIVVDNNSDDGSQEMLKKDFRDQVKLMASQENIGFGPANNQGAGLARGEFLFFLNSDTIIKDNILNPLAKFFKDNPKAGAVGPKLLLEDESGQPYAYGKFPGLLSIVFRQAGRQELGMEPLAVDWVSGAALVISQDIFNKINGFDENFFMYFEDIDICQRVKALGLGVFVIPEASLVHLGGQSIDRPGKRKKIYYQSQDYYFKKHYGWFKMVLLKLIRWPFKILTLSLNKYRFK